MTLWVFPDPKTTILRPKPGKLKSVETIRDPIRLDCILQRILTHKGSEHLIGVGRPHLGNWSFYVWNACYRNRDLVVRRGSYRNRHLKHKVHPATKNSGEARHLWKLLLFIKQGFPSCILTAYLAVSTLNPNHKDPKGSHSRSPIVKDDVCKGVIVLRSPYVSTSCLASLMCSPMAILPPSFPCTSQESLMCTETLNPIP